MLQAAHGQPAQEKTEKMYKRSLRETFLTYVCRGQTKPSYFATEMCDISVKYIGINVYFVTEMCDISVKCINDECSFFSTYDVPIVFKNVFLCYNVCIKLFIQLYF